MLDLKKILNKPVNLSGSKESGKNPMMDKFRDSKVKHVNLQYKEDKKEVIIDKLKPVRLKKQRERVIKDTPVTEKESVKNTSKSNKQILKTADKLTKPKAKEKKTKLPKTKQVEPIKSVSSRIRRTKELKSIEEKVLGVETSVIETIIIRKELSPEVIKAKEDLANLKKKFYELLLPVKWSREVMYED